MANIKGEKKKSLKTVKGMHGNSMFNIFTPSKDVSSSILSIRVDSQK